MLRVTSQFVEHQPPLAVEVPAEVRLQVLPVFVRPVAQIQRRTPLCAGEGQPALPALGDVVERLQGRGGVHLRQARGGSRTQPAVPQALLTSQYALVVLAGLLPHGPANAGSAVLLRVDPALVLPGGA
jgi:hypothetical protein